MFSLAMSYKLKKKFKVKMKFCFKNKLLKTKYTSSTFNPSMMSKSKLFFMINKGKYSQRISAWHED